MERFNAMGKEFSINDEVMCRDDEDGVFVQYEDVQAELTRLEMNIESMTRVATSYLDLLDRMELWIRNDPHAHYSFQVENKRADEAQAIMHEARMFLDAYKNRI